MSYTDQQIKEKLSSWINQCYKLDRNNQFQNDEQTLNNAITLINQKLYWELPRHFPLDKPFNLQSLMIERPDAVPTKGNGLGGSRFDELRKYLFPQQIAEAEQSVVMPVKVVTADPVSSRQTTLPVIDSVQPGSSDESVQTPTSSIFVPQSLLQLSYADTKRLDNLLADKVDALENNDKVTAAKLDRPIAIQRAIIALRQAGASSTRKHDERIMPVEDLALNVLLHMRNNPDSSFKDSYQEASSQVIMLKASEAEVSSSLERHFYYWSNDLKRSQSALNTICGQVEQPHEQSEHATPEASSSNNNTLQQQRSPGKRSIFAHSAGKETNLSEKPQEIRPEDESPSSGI